MWGTDGPTSTPIISSLRQGGGYGAAPLSAARGVRPLAGPPLRAPAAELIPPNAGCSDLPVAAVFVRRFAAMHASGIVVLVAIGLVGVLALTENVGGVTTDGLYAPLLLIGAFAAFIELTNVLSGQGL